MRFAAFVFSIIIPTEMAKLDMTGRIGGKEGVKGILLQDWLQQLLSESDSDPVGCRRSKVPQQR